LTGGGAVHPDVRSNAPDASDHRTSHSADSNIRRITVATGVDPIVFYLIIFVLAIFVGYHVVWSVTPALHTPLMSVTNAISSIILVGAMLAAGPAAFDWGGWVGVVAVVLASINVFGGFLVTQRMLEMFKKREPKAGSAPKH
jgi:NAD(P) transhydrogenase subunit alpha